MNKLIIPSSILAISAGLIASASPKDARADEPTRPTDANSTEEGVESLILAKRESLIKATVVDPNTRDQLLELNQRIAALRASDPEAISAWGLGCGQHCVSATESSDEPR